MKTPNNKENSFVIKVEPRNEAFWAMLKSLRIRYVLGRFSGGHDEGGYDNVTFIMDDGSEIASEEFAKNNLKTVNEPTLLIFVDDKNNTIGRVRLSPGESYNPEVETIRTVLLSVLDEAYGNFGGHPSVIGYVVLSTKTQTINRIGYEEVTECRFVSDVETDDEEDTDFLEKLEDEI